MKKIWMFLMTIICSIGIAICVAQAWFINGFDVDPLATGSSTEAYYHSGTGTSDDPYIITTPRHLYNLAWLQYLGKYNKDKKNGKDFPATYFKIGTSAGITIDMTDWPLPPIGTAKYPFIGNFNGNGATITNLTTTNKFTEFNGKTPSGVNGSNFEADYCGTIGFFGAIGAYDGNIISESDSTNNSFTYDTANNKVYNFYLNDNEVHTCRSTTLIGAVAGYVNAEISNVGVIQPHLDIQESATSKLSGKTSNLSDFAVVGYAEQQYTTQKTKSSTIIYNPTYDYSHFNFKGMGSSAGWGGSINFANTYQRIYNIVKSTSDSTNKIDSNNANFVGSEIQYYKVVNGLSVIDTNRTNVTNYTTSFNNFSTSTTTGVKYYNYNNANGSYLRTCNSDDSDQYMTLTALYKDVIIVTKTEDTESGYKISDIDGDYYLDITSTRATGTLTYSATINNTSTNQRVWVLSGSTSGYLYTYNENDGNKYYLNATTSALSVSSSTTGRTTWYYDSVNNGFYFIDGGFNYYLKRYNNIWCTTPLYLISDNNGHYLKMSSTTDNPVVTNTTTAADATIWDFSTYGINPSGSIRTINNGFTRYLNINNNGNLVTNETAKTWSNSGSGINDGTNYIQFKNGYWVAEPNPSYKIGYSTHYLSASGSDTTSANAALWTLSNNLANNGGNGTITIRIDGVLNYLGNNNGNLSLSNISSMWQNVGGVLYNFGNNQVSCLQYDNGWKLIDIDYYIVDQNGNYLTFNTATSITNATSPTTLWHFSDVSNYPCGIISYNNNNDTFYLEINGTNVVLSTISNTTWYNDGDGLYCLINNVKNFLVYDNGWKVVSYSYKISYGTNYLSIDSGGNIITTNEVSATNWIFSNPGTNPSGTISSSGHYLYLENGVLTTTTNANEALIFSNNGNGLYDANDNYLQLYQNKWVCGKSFNIHYNSTYMSWNGSQIGTSNWIWFYYSDSDEPQGYIYTIYNGVLYYLYNNNGTLTCNQNNPTNWSRDSYGLYINNNGIKYIQYDNGWKLSSVKTVTYNQYYISRSVSNWFGGSTYYLVRDGEQLTYSTDSNPSSGKWIFTVSGSYPSGQIYQINNGIKYYLHINDGNLSISTTEPHTFTNLNSGRLRDTNTGYYLYDNNSTWNFNWTGSSSYRQCTFTNSGDSIEIDDYDSTHFATTSLDSTYTSILITTSTTNNRSDYAMETYNSLTFNSITNRCYTSQVFTNYAVTGNVDAIVYTNSGTNYTGTNALPSIYSAIPITTKGDKLTEPPADYSTGTNYVVDDSNTGYIISGGHEPRKAADLRISYFDRTKTYNTGVSGINLPSGLISGSYANSTLSNIYTITQNGNSYSTKIITESSSNGIQTNDCGFTKYFDSKTTLQETLNESGNNIYGAHFMNAPISKTKYIIVPEVLINGERKTNFQMPEDCIDFTLKSKGSINFFSSYFYYNSSDGGANNCFFSLNEIIRDANNNISQIRHILKVYEKKSDGTYVYYYQDIDTNVTGYYTRDTNKNIVTVSAFDSSDYTLKFDADWIEDPAKSGLDSNNRYNFWRSGNNANYGNFGDKIFYFEIPANVGEYALGSVSKTDASGNVYNGAYIMYLDIGANASIVDRTSITQQSNVINENMKYATGIQLLASGSTFSSDSNSCVAVIKTSNIGQINITRTGNTVSFGGTSLDSTYWDEGLTVTDGTLNVPTDTKVTKVLKYIDFNNGTNSLYYATVIDNNGTKTYEVLEIDGNTNTLIANQDTLNPEDQPYGLLKIGTGDDAGYGVIDNATDALAANRFATSSKTVEYYYTIPTSIITNDGVAYSFDMSVVQVTGNETIGNFSIEAGEYEFDDGYTSTHCYKLTGDDITYVFTQIPTGTTTTTFVVTTKDGTYTVTINGTTINVGNYTYTFSTNTIATP